MWVAICLVREKQHQFCGADPNTQLKNDDQTEGAQIRYITYYPGSNNVGSTGIKLLIKAELLLL